MTSAKPSATLGFVDRVEEMKCILDALNVASTGKGQLLLVRGEAGSGKSRLLQEGATEAEKQGFTIGFGTALAESVVPYHAWKEVLEGLGLGAILEEAPPPKLLGLYLLTPDGRMLVKAERGGEDVDEGNLTRSMNILKEFSQGSLDPKYCEWTEGQFSAMQEEGNRILAGGGADFTLGAVLEGQEDERLLTDLQAMMGATASLVQDTRTDDAEPDAAATPLQQLLDSRKYEGIDYFRKDPKLRQTRFFEQVALGLARKASLQPVLVVFDDLQWADPSSLALLLYVARNTHESDVLLLGTYRTEEAESRTHLRDALNGMEQEELVAEMDLKGLAHRDLADLATSFLGSHSLPDGFIDSLWRETRGNPLFVREVLQGLEEDGAIALHAGVKTLDRPLDQIALPERVREVVRDRLNRLSKEDRQLLDGAATCGTRFTAALLAKVAGDEEENVLNGLRTIANAHGLLRPSGEGYAFDHPVVQEVLYEDMAPEHRQAYHREAAQWLERAGGPVEDIGEHYYRAGDPRAARILCEGARGARERYSNSEAIRFYHEALELEENPRTRMDILMDLAAVHDLIGQYEECIESYVSALELAGDRFKRAEIKANIGFVYRIRGEREDAVEACTEALRLVAGEDCKEEALALNCLGLAVMYMGQFERALESCERSLEIYDKMGDNEGIANSLNTIGFIHFEKGEYRRALEFHKRSLEMREKIGDQKLIAHSLTNIGIQHHYLGEIEEAIEHFMKGKEIFERIGDQIDMSISLNNIGVFHFERGRFHKALECYEKSLDIRERIGDQHGISGSLNNIGLVLAYKGDYDGALECHNKSLAIKEKTGDQSGVAESLDNIGVVHRKRGEHGKATENLRKAMEIYEEIGDKEGLSEVYCDIAEESLEKRDLEKALEYCGKAFDVATEIGLKSITAESKKISGMIHREQGRWEESIEDFEKSIQLLEGINLMVELGETHLEFGLMWKAKGDREKAGETLDTALGIFEGLELEYLAGIVRDAAQDL